MEKEYNQSINGDNNIQVGELKGVFPDPLKVYDGDLRTLITAFRKFVPTDYTKESKYRYDSIVDKNTKNKMNPDYFNVIVEDDLPYFYDIDAFLRDPRSVKYAEMYDETARDLQSQFLANRERFDSVDMFLSHIYGSVFEALQVEFPRERRKIRTFLHHMYWKCSIGVR